MSTAALTFRFLRRELSNRFAGSFSGGLWALMQPLLQLAITSLVFVYVFKARVPNSDSIGYVAFLATALWPWTAFSEAVLRTTTVIQDNAALIGKVALPREVLVFASVAASFAIHIVGFVAIMLVLSASGQGVSLSGLLPALLLFVPLFGLALGFALICASTQVFVRDLVQALAQIMQLLMFAAPIYYAREMLPASVRGWVDLHPFTFYAESFRALMLHHGEFGWTRLATAVGIAAIFAWLGHRMFRRLDPHFEDFL